MPRGGALETVVGRHDPAGRPPTGVFFHRQDAADALAAALDELEAGPESFDPQALAEHAAGFDTGVFMRRMSAYLAEALASSEVDPAGEQ